MTEFSIKEFNQFEMIDLISMRDFVFVNALERKNWSVFFQAIQAKAVNQSKDLGLILESHFRRKINQ